MPAASVDPAEIARFNRLAGEWWDPKGKMAPLHAMNPARLGFIRDEAVKAFRLDPERIKVLSGLTALDTGCGGGILSEPLARLGASVTGLDLAEDSLAAARAHAAEEGLSIDYRCQAVEELAASGQRFDLVCALEVVEHVADLAAFVAAACAALKPGGLIVFSTLNRSKRAFAAAIIGAEYLFRWLPKGTHQWEKFVTPDELEAALEANGLTVTDERGMVFNPLSGAWRLADDMAVNYLMAARKA